MENVDLMKRCRIARDYLFSIKAEGGSGSLLVGSGLSESDALNVWKRISQRLHKSDYKSHMQFIDDIIPMKNILLNCSPRPTKKRVKQIDSVFNRISHISNPNQPLSFAQNSNPCSAVLDLLNGDTAPSLLEEFHRHGKSLAKEIRANHDCCVEHRTNSGRMLNFEGSPASDQAKQRRNSNFADMSPHPTYHGVYVKAATNVGGNNNFIACITLKEGRGRSSAISTVFLQEAPCQNAMDAARVHDLACIRARGPQSCQYAPRTLDNLEFDDDDSYKLNFDIAKYAEEEMKSFTQWDTVLIQGLSGVKQWSGLQTCDFSFILFSQNATSKVAKSNHLSTNIKKKLSDDADVSATRGQDLNDVTKSNSNEANTTSESIAHDESASATSLDVDDRHSVDNKCDEGCAGKENSVSSTPSSLGKRERSDVDICQ